METVDLSLRRIVNRRLFPIAGMKAGLIPFKTLEFENVVETSVIQQIHKDITGEEIKTHTELQDIVLFRIPGISEYTVTYKNNPIGTITKTFSRANVLTVVFTPVNFEG